jgi:hypothetical protein
MFPFDARLKYVVKGRMWERRWRDWRFLKAKAHGPRYQIEILGLPGIGKTCLTNQLVKSFGERVPTLMPSRELSPEWAETLAEIVDHRIDRLHSSDADSWMKIHQMDYFVQCLRFDVKTMRRYYGQVLINSENLLRSNPDFFVDAASTNLPLVEKLLKNRLIVYCTSNDPVGRSVRGQQSRGDHDMFQRDHATNEKSLARYQKFLDLLSQGVTPVLTINLDDPYEHSAGRIAQWLRVNNISGKRINLYSPESPASSTLTPA